MQRSVHIFENSIKSEETRSTYLRHLNNFLGHFKIKDADKLASIPQKEVQIMVEDYVIHLKNIMSPNSIPIPIASLKAFLDCNDIELRWGKINRLKPARVKKTGSEAWLTEEVQQMLSSTSEIRTKTIIHILASSGMRVGGLDGLKMKHIKNIEDCKSITVYEGTIDEYTTFLTPESSLILDQYIAIREADGEKLTPESPVIRSVYQLGYAKVKPASKDSIKEIIRFLIHKSGLRINQVKTGKRYNKQADHAFRKRFNTILKTTEGLNISLAEKMMGHSTTVQMDNVYLDPTTDMLFKEYKKAVPELTISNSERQKVKINQLESEKSELEKLQKQNSLLNNRYAFQEMMRNELKAMGFPDLKPREELLEKGDKKIEELFKDED